MNDTFGTCRFCGYRAYIPATKHGVMCPICNMKGKRTIISRY